MIDLPRHVQLACPGCKRKFSLSSRDLDGLDLLSCPFCRSSHEPLRFMPASMRLLLYREVRECLENRALDWVKSRNPLDPTAK